MPKTVQDCGKECTLNSQPNRPYNSERVFGSNSVDLQKSDGFDVPFFFLLRVNNSWEKSDPYLISMFALAWLFWWSFSDRSRK